MADSIGLPGWVAWSFGLVTGVVVVNAILMHHIRVKEAEGRERWLISGARNVAARRARSLNTKEGVSLDPTPGAPYSLLEPRANANYLSVIFSGALYATLISVIGYVIFAANNRSIHPVPGSDFLEQLWVNAREILFFAFVATCFSGVVQVSLAALYGVLAPSTFVRVTMNSVLTCIGGVVLLLIARVFNIDAVVMRAETLFIGFLPLLLMYLRGVRAVAELGGIRGMGFFDRLDLVAHGVTDIHALARVNPASLYVSSGIEAYRLVDCLGQAQLLSAVLESGYSFKGNDIRTIFDLVAALNDKEFASTAGLSAMNAALIESRESYRALRQFREIIDTPHQDLGPGTPAVLGGLLEEHVTKAVGAAMFGEVPVRYSGFVRFNLVPNQRYGLSNVRDFTAVVSFAGVKREEPGWQAIDIWEGTHENEVAFRLRFDSDAPGFESSEVPLLVPADGTLRRHESTLTLNMESDQNVWVTIIQGSRTIQVIEVAVAQKG